MIKIRLWSIGQILLSWNQWTMHFVKAIITISSNQILLSFLFSASLQNFHFFNTGAIRNTSKGVCLLFARVLYVEALLHFLCIHHITMVRSHASTLLLCSFNFSNYFHLIFELHWLLQTIFRPFLVLLYTPVHSTDFVIQDTTWEGQVGGQAVNFQEDKDSVE